MHGNISNSLNNSCKKSWEVTYNQEYFLAISSNWARSSFGFDIMTMLSDPLINFTLLGRLCSIIQCWKFFCRILSLSVIIKIRLTDPYLSPDNFSSRAKSCVVYAYNGLTNIVANVKSCNKIEEPRDYEQIHLVFIF